MGDCSRLNLPPGFRFCPTDEELVSHFLYPKASLSSSCSNLIPELFLPPDPWKLHGKALSSGNQWYFFTQKKIMQGHQETENGFWKHLDIEEPILSDAGTKIGLKKLVMYYIGQHPTAIETSWMMQEYHLSKSSTSALFADISYKRNRNSLDCHERVLCRVYQRKESSQSLSCTDDEDDDGDGDDDDGTELSCLDEVFLSLEDDVDDDLCFLPN
ncbi:NAC domain-containing protein 104 [Ricinus communis]|uniref:NAC domain-containing protein 104 n=1 Tax=Ricinus communis TaxID=3988 RepID=UPI00201AF1FC|nr:NAC domain-containing protein 104 [Ricinus communis]